MAARLDRILVLEIRQDASILRLTCGHRAVGSSHDFVHLDRLQGGFLMGKRGQQFICMVGIDLHMGIEIDRNVPVIEAGPRQSLQDGAEMRCHPRFGRQEHAVGAAFPGGPGDEGIEAI